MQLINGNSFVSPQSELISLVPQVFSEELWYLPYSKMNEKGKKDEAMMFSGCSEAFLLGKKAKPESEEVL